MEPVIQNWREQDEYFGLDYSTASAKIGDYKFDIRMDCDLTNPKIKPISCGLVMTISYKDRIVENKFGNTVKDLKAFADRWFTEEVIRYYHANCVLLESLK